jgi:glutaconate CoA-transferase subunit B
VSGEGHTAEEMMAVAAARRLRDGANCFVGVGLPSRAANLARAAHAPNCVLIYESGTIGAKPRHLPLSIGDGELAETADLVVSVPEIFSYWLQGGRIDVGFLGAAQIDRYANLNSTVIGEYERPKVRLPGGGGAPEIAASCKETLVMLRHSSRAFVERLDFRTTVGYGDGPGARERLGLKGRGVSAVTDPACSSPTETRAHALRSPGCEVDEVRAATGWELRVSDRLMTRRRPKPSSPRSAPHPRSERRMLRDDGREAPSTRRPAGRSAVLLPRLCGTRLRRAARCSCCRTPCRSCRRRSTARIGWRRPTPT